MQKTQRELVKKQLWNMKTHISWSEHVSDQILGSKYMVTSITSWEENFDISTTTDWILGGFFFVQKVLFPLTFIDLYPTIWLTFGQVIVEVL